MDGDDQDDSQDDGHHGGSQVVGDGSTSNSARERHIQRPHGRYQGGDDQWEDESFQHPEEDLPNVGDVHHLALMPVVLTLTEDQAEHHPADDAAHGGDSQGVHPQTSHRFLSGTHPEQDMIVRARTALGRGPQSYISQHFCPFQLSTV